MCVWSESAVYKYATRRSITDLASGRNGVPVDSGGCLHGQTVLSLKAGQVVGREVLGYGPRVRREDRLTLRARAPVRWHLVERVEEGNRNGR